jgi:hypothetical protein
VHRLISKLNCENTISLKNRQLNNIIMSNETDNAWGNETNKVVATTTTTEQDSRPGPGRGSYHQGYKDGKRSIIKETAYQKGYRIGRQDGLAELVRRNQSNRGRRRGRGRYRGRGRGRGRGTGRSTKPIQVEEITEVETTTETNEANATEEPTTEANETAE